MHIFPDLFGNTAAKERLGRAIVGGTLPHALILSGPAGSGKRHLARRIAAALLCEDKGEHGALPCGECRACRQVTEGIFPDLHIVAPEEGKSVLTVGRIRAIRAELTLTASEADFRVFIIENADRMNAAAQNALLVSLEEPPDGVVFLLISEVEEALLPTVRSRCQTVRLEVFEDDRLREFLEGDERFLRLLREDPARASALLEGAHGTVGEALRLLDGRQLAEVVGRRETVDAIITALTARGSAPLYEALRPLSACKRDELSALLTMLCEALRDLILLKRCAGAPLLYYYDRTRAAELCEKLGIRKLYTLADAAEEATEGLSRNANISVVLSSLLYATLGS